jgi:hypothetical protein
MEPVTTMLAPSPTTMAASSMVVNLALAKLIRVLLKKAILTEGDRGRKRERSSQKATGKGIWKLISAREFF